MPAPAWDDLDIFLSDDDFAVTAIIVASGVTRPGISALYDGPYLNAQIGEFEMDSIQPRIMAKESDLRGIRRGDTVTLHGQDLPPAGRQFAIMGAAMEDGNGMAIVRLAIEP